MPKRKMKPDVQNIGITQNGKQSLTDSYSYTIYDGLGRIEEVGETEIVGGITQTAVQMAEDPSTLVPPERTEITHTGYDAAYISDGHFDPLFHPEHLRGRVSYSWEKDSYNDVNYRMGTFYSYDAHGNVKTLFHDYHEGVMEDAGNAFKRMDYEYDLISGKVREVRYQDGEADAFYHRYRYDGENRLKTVETSRDKILWQRDAKYGYYKHGPLARLELGDLGVQGLDYAYTLQGWLKGINSTGVGGGAFDMGADGKTGTANALFARDVYGMSLNYYNKTESGITRVDYSPINTSGLGTNTPFLAGGVTELTASSNAVATSLFNGNIASMFVNIRKLTTGTNNAPDALLYAYRYDQLNRLKKMQVFEGFDDATNSWATQAATDDYKEAVDYDANGNIIHYLRNGRNSVHGLNMDNLSYHYKTNNNQLRSVSDAAGGNYTNDIKDQVNSDNYVYDEIGNLTKDEAAGITGVKWTVYGKVGSIWKACSGCGLQGYEALKYTYDAGSNRISKTYKSAPDASPKTTWYVRDASGNVMSVYEKEQGRSGGDLVQSEVHVYGSGRLGIYEPEQVVEGMQLETGHHSFTRRKKLYELVNQLGNVLVTVTDRAVPVPDNQTPPNVAGYVADVASASDYYPFGMQMPGRIYNAGNLYRYGFNGQEKSDDVTKGNYTAQFWEYDSRIGRRWNLDPKPTIGLSHYATFANNPIWIRDRNGDDTTRYYDNKKNLLMTIGNGKAGYNRIMVVNDDKIDAIKKYAYENALDIVKKSIKNNVDIDNYFLKNNYGVAYDLNAIRKFYDDNKNRKARYLDAADKYYGKELTSYGLFTYEGKKLNFLRSETTGGLVLQNNIVTVGGSKYFINRDLLTGGDYPNTLEPGQVAGIHNHPFGKNKIDILNYKNGGSFGHFGFHSGPSDDTGDRSAGNKPKAGYRNVVVDDANIYLYDDDPNHKDIDIKR